MRHVFPNAFAPTLTLVGLTLGHLLGGVAVIETVFTLPGLGRLMVDSVLSRDYPVIQGCLLYGSRNVGSTCSSICAIRSLTRVSRRDESSTASRPELPTRDVLVGALLLTIVIGLCGRRMIACHRSGAPAESARAATLVRHR